MTNPTRAEVEALKMRPVRRKHVFHGPEDHANSWESDSCQACVLSLCKVCQGAEASLPTDCPGRKMTCEEEDAVQNGTLDFVRDCWVVPRAYAATLPPEDKPTPEMDAIAQEARFMQLLKALAKAMIEIAEIKYHDPLPPEQLAKISKERAVALGHAMGIMDACMYLKAAIAQAEEEKP